MERANNAWATRDHIRKPSYTITIYLGNKYYYDQLYSLTIRV